MQTPAAESVTMRLESLTVNTTVHGATMMGTLDMIIDSVQEAQVVPVGQATVKVLVDRVVVERETRSIIISVCMCIHCCDS